MMSAFNPARVPTRLDTSAITGTELRIHPDDYLELLCTRGHCWPKNSDRNLWMNTRLVEDYGVAMMARVPL